MDGLNGIFSSKTMVSGTAKNNVKSAWQLKMVMLWNEKKNPFVKMICSRTEI